MSDKLTFEELEQVYDLLAASVDAAGARRELFLCKLCMTLAHNIGDLSVIEEAIAIARADLDT